MPLSERDLADTYQCRDDQEVIPRQEFPTIAQELGNKAQDDSNGANHHQSDHCCDNCCIFRLRQVNTWWGGPENSAVRHVVCASAQTKHNDSRNREMQLRRMNREGRKKTRPEPMNACTGVRISLYGP